MYYISISGICHCRVQILPDQAKPVWAKIASQITHDNAALLGMLRSAKSICKPNFSLSLSKYIYNMRILRKRPYGKLDSG